MLNACRGLCTINSHAPRTRRDRNSGQHVWQNMTAQLPSLALGYGGLEHHKLAWLGCKIAAHTEVKLLPSAGDLHPPMRLSWSILSQDFCIEVSINKIEVCEGGLM